MHMMRNQRRWAVVLAAVAALASGYGPGLATQPESAGTPAACPNAQFTTLGALNIADGAVEWMTCSPDEAYRRVIGASDDVVLIEESGPLGSSPRTIAFDAADGTELWRRSTADSPSSPGPFDGQGIVVLASGHALVGVEPGTGEEKWQIESNEAPLAHSATVAVVGSSRFRGIDRVTGEELWVSDVLLSDQSGVMVERSPAAVVGEVVVVPTGTTVTAVDLRTGAMLWQAPQLDFLNAADGVIVGTRGVGPSTLVTAIDAATGQQLWAAPGVSSYGGLLAVDDGVIVVYDSDSPELVAYELSSGNERWRSALTTRIDPQLISGTTLVMLWEGEIAVVSTTDGATIWSATQPFQSAWMNSVGANGDSVFVAINSLPWMD